MFLTDSQVNLLNQIIKDGVEQANVSLKEMLGNRLMRVEVTDPQLLTIEELAKQQEILDENEQVSGAYMDFSGPFCGQAMLVCPREEKNDLMMMFFEPLIYEGMSEEDLEDVTTEAICELSNILLSTCIASFGRIFDGEIRIRVPKPVTGDFVEMMHSKSEQRRKKVLFMPTTIYIGEGDRHLGFGFVFDMISVHALAICLDAHIEKASVSKGIF